MQKNHLSLKFYLSFNLHSFRICVSSIWIVFYWLSTCDVPFFLKFLTLPQKQNTHSYISIGFILVESCPTHSAGFNVSRTKAPLSNTHNFSEFLVAIRSLCLWRNMDLVSVLSTKQHPSVLQLTQFNTAFWYSFDSTLNCLSAGQWHSVGKKIQVPVIPLFSRLELTWDNDSKIVFFTRGTERQTDSISQTSSPSLSSSLTRMVPIPLLRENITQIPPAWLLGYSSLEEMLGKANVQMELYSRDKVRATHVAMKPIQLHRNPLTKQAEKAGNSDYWTPSTHSKLVSAGFHPCKTHTYTQLFRYILLP